MKRCENCEEEHNGEYGSGRFCSIKCANTRKLTQKIKDKISNKLTKNKIKICISCNANKVSTRKTKYCKQCKKYIQNIKLFKKLNILDTNLLIANKKAINIICDIYFNEEQSLLFLKKEYHIMFNTIYDFFKKNDIKLRDNTDATNLSILHNRDNKTYKKNVYKQGKHITWNNKNIYYRSSYELDYAMYLDNLKIDYDVEKIRIKYFDTVLNKERIAIPDFYLIDSNTLVEIKSKYTLDEINMLNKKEAYLKNGYNFKLILDKKEVIF